MKTRQRAARPTTLSREDRRRAKPVRLSDQLHVLACVCLDLARVAGLEGWEDILVDHFPSVLEEGQLKDKEAADGPA